MKKNVMFISSVGGHLTQLLQLKEIFEEYNYVLITEKTDVTEDLKTKYRIDYLKYGSRHYFSYVFIFLYNVFKSIIMFFKYKPKVIVTTGTHTAVPMCYIGKLLVEKLFL